MPPSEAASCSGEAKRLPSGVACRNALGYVLDCTWSQDGETKDPGRT
jgi:hypothetical protein